MLDGIIDQLANNPVEVQFDLFGKAPAFQIGSEINGESPFPGNGIDK
jgi:hypothetical protein